MPMPKRVLLAILLLLASQAYAGEGVAPDERKDIEELLRVSGALNISKMFSEAVVKQMSTVLKRTRPDIPANMLDMVTDEVNKTVAEAITEKGGFVDLMVPIYQKYYSPEEIKELLAFYKTPLGQKVIKVMPAMMQESMAIGQRWGQGLGPVIAQRVTARFKQKGITI